jgi:hypothetical protein
LNIITTILELSEENRMAIHAEFQAEESV